MTATGAPRRKITLERTYKAAIQEAWDLWTTKEGVESWWGPDGFEVKVRKLDLRPGGEMHYDMIAVARDKIEFMKNAGMQTATPARLTYTEIVPLKRVAYTHLADFIQGVEPYDVDMLVELFPTADGVRLVLTFDAMHDEIWTQRAVSGWEDELGKLAKVFER